jgi:osmotically-inducible protein OsmY
MIAFRLESDGERQSRNMVKMAQNRLRRNGYSGLGAVSCRFERGVLFLRGQLPCYYHKQLAQEAVRGLVGVSQVVNEIEVTPG